jgi:ribosomal protein S18 acetylase RimI-like enzyme
MNHELTLRPITPDDMDLLYHIYASTREAELAQVDWSAEQRAAFLQMQFDAQHRYYQENYPGAQFQAIVLHGQGVGRLYLDRRAAEIRIVDIALVPEARGRGVGSALLCAILAEGERDGLPVTIHVECFNPALRLYERLGFRKVEDKGVYYFLEKLPDRSPGKTRAAEARGEPMLAQLCGADFAPYVHQTFLVHLEGIEPIKLELVGVTELRSPGPAAGPRREPFTLLFLGPVSRQYLLQRTYRLEHEQLGTLDLFLVPLGPEQGRMRYEAVFN